MGKTLVRLGLIASIVAVVALTGCGSKAGGVSLPAGDRVLQLDSVALTDTFSSSTTKSGHTFAVVTFTGAEGTFDSDASEADSAGLEAVSHDVKLSTAGGPGDLYSWGKSAVFADGKETGYELNLVFIIPDDTSGLTLNWPEKEPIDLDPYVEP